MNKGLVHKTFHDDFSLDGCGISVNKCPIEAITLIDGITHNDENKCIGCGVCVHHCPENARTLERTEQREV